MSTVLGYGSRRLSGIPDTATTPLLQQLTSKIRFNGPITVAEYMKEVLTNPVGLIGVWCVNEWVQAGGPANLHVVELGPGRGTLADDMLRVFAQFPKVRDAVSLHLVEVSPRLSEMQYSKLTNSQSQGSAVSQTTSSEPCYRSCVSYHNFNVHWYRQLADVPKGPSFFIAHEFFDVLPIHKFQFKDGGWHEVLVDVDDAGSLRFVLSPSQTLASQLLLKLDAGDCRDHVEVCPDAGIIAAEVADRIARYHGFGLIADYGHTGDKTDTFRAFRDHKLCDALSEPGMADLTADVDFKYITQCVGDKVLPVGPIIQDTFLHNMGVILRLQMLMSNASDRQKKSLLSGYDMLTNHNKMGERFKFMALLPKSRDPSYKPAGFVEPT